MPADALVFAMADAVIAYYGGRLRYNRSCKVGYFLYSGDPATPVDRSPNVRQTITNIADALPADVPRFYNGPFRDRIEAEIKFRVSVLRSSLSDTGRVELYHTPC